MPPRGNSAGFDLTPILTHYFFLLTSILAIVAWWIAFIAQAVATAKFTNNAVGVLWFAIFLQAFLILGVLYTLATDSIAMHRFQISTFGAVAIVFAVSGVQEGIFSPAGALDAMAAGWLILAMVNILWVLYFTSEEDSRVLHVFNLLGNGGLTPPSRRRTRARSTHDLGGGNGYAGNYGSGGGIGSHDMYDSKGPASAGIGGGGGGSFGAGAGIRSQNSFGAGSEGRAAGSLSNPNIAPSGGAGSLGGGNDNGPSSPLMSGVGGGSAAGSAAGGEDAAGGTYQYKAKALYSYNASPDDPNEVSFTKGEILEILDKQGKWWQAKKADGSVGIAPSNYLQII